MTIICQIGSPSPVSVMYFVESLEDKEITGVHETLGYLSPDFAYLVLDFKIFGYICSSRFEIKPETIAAGTVVMKIYDYVQPGFFCITYNFSNAFQTVINNVVRSRTDMANPSDR